MSWNVLIPDAVDMACDNVLRAGGCSVKRVDRPSEEELLDIVGEYDAMVVRSAVKVTAPIIERMTRMKVIGRAGAGVDNIDTATATRAGILVMNTPGGNTVSAAEHTIALLLSLLRRIPDADRSMKSGEWGRKEFSGTELYGKKVGVVGLGKIGREVLARLLPFEILALGFDPVLGDAGIWTLGAEPVTFDDLIQRADIITFHVPLNDETRGMVGDDEIERMKPGVRLINCARGGVIDEDALVRGLESGKIAGAALDVYSSEPLEMGNRLIGAPNLVLTPHIAASTDEAQHRVAVAIAEGILGLLAGEEISGLVNAGDVGSAYSQATEAPFRIARAMGHLLAALYPPADLDIELSVYNRGEQTSRSGLVATLLTGLFDGSPGGATPINASVIAEESGITATVVRELDESRHSACLHASISNGADHSSLMMALSSSGEPRIVEINGREVEFDPYGEVLIIEHTDRPGMIATISEILAARLINISDLSLGRRQEGSALTLIRTDESLDEEVVRRIAEIDGIHTARAISVLR